MPDTITVGGNRKPITWRLLLSRAAAIYDTPDSMLAKTAGMAARGAFATGAEWMALAIERLRGESLKTPLSALPNFQLLGVLKYSAAITVAAGWVLASYLAGWLVLSPLALPIFYAVEVQYVFLFPIALDGHLKPFRTSRQWTKKAGGTLLAMKNVMPIAATMLGGGFVGRGFIRSWCLGCLAICIWYEHLRISEIPPS